MLMKSVFPLPGCLAKALVPEFSACAARRIVLQLSEFVSVSKTPLFVAFGGGTLGWAQWRERR
jgi:hypothetical protein